MSNVGEATQYGWLAAMAISGVGTLVTILVKRSVGEQDRKLDRMVVVIDGIATTVGDHATKLAAGEQVMRDAERRLSALERQVLEVSIKGCARACADHALRPENGR